MRLHHPYHRKTLTRRQRWFRVGLLLTVLAVAAFFVYPFFPQNREVTNMSHTNHLIHETSPYLLQHAHNPVDWYPWGVEALAKAKRENKPIFLSVGYSTCYWCHVMEKECFENQEVADILNQHFVSIKVDREERPDIDELYMIATQLMTGRGGWPNSVWLTPDGRPWMAGTYFPRKPFMELLENLAETWETRQSDVQQQANQLAKEIRRVGRGARDTSAGPVDQAMVDQAVATITASFDPIDGGFRGAPKFPPHTALRLLIHEYRRTKDPALQSLLVGTLNAMARGGVRDHLGGGFHRYATDGRWFLPHFEKMLYDNAQLLRTYTDGYLLTGEKEYRRVAGQIVDWLAREMTTPDGAFCTAQDAGAVGEEGDFYVWGYDEIIEVLGKKDGADFAKAYGANPTGNFHEEASGKPSGKNILHLPEATTAEIREGRVKLLAVRNRRKAPHKDDKILAGNNGLMIASLAYAGKQLREPAYTKAAQRAANFILTHMIGKDGRLLRSYRMGKAKVPGYLDDYAFFLEGLLALYDGDSQERWLSEAVKLADIMLADFVAEGGGFYFASTQHEDLLLRSRNVLGGGNTPAANGIAAIVLFKVGRLTGEARYTQAARATVQSLRGAMQQSPRSSETLLLAAAESFLNPSAQSASAAAPLIGQVTQYPIVAGFLPPTPAAPGQGAEVTLLLRIAKGYHIYSPTPGEKFLLPTSLTLAPTPAATLGEIAWPAAKTLSDPVLKKPVSVYEGEVKIQIPLALAKDAAPGPLQLTWTLKTQACDEKQCYAPQNLTLTLPLKVIPAP